MQYLKDDIKNKIMQSALAEFRENGYEGSSMREIAANAGIVSGNIYRYFKNKEDLFNCIVEPAYGMIDRLMLQFKKEMEDNSETLVGSDCFKVVKSISSHILEIFTRYSTETLIILDKSQGTKYANSKEKLKNILSGVLHDIYHAELKKHGKELKDDFILDIMSSSFIDGVCLILRNCKNSEHAIELFDSWNNIVFRDLYQRI
jgi:AcrR family transcriptional regulator